MDLHQFGEAMMAVIRPMLQAQGQQLPGLAAAAAAAAAEARGPAGGERSLLTRLGGATMKVLDFNLWAMGAMNLCAEMNLDRAWMLWINALEGAYAVELHQQGVTAGARPEEVESLEDMHEYLSKQLGFKEARDKRLRRFHAKAPCGGATYPRVHRSLPGRSQRDTCERTLWGGGEGDPVSGRAARHQSTRLCGVQHSCTGRPGAEDDERD
jgi:hypothetical protein